MGLKVIKLDVNNQDHRMVIANIFHYREVKVSFQLWNKRNEIDEWVEENIPNQVYTNGGLRYYFFHSEDAMQFKLVWGG